MFTRTLSLNAQKALVLLGKSKVLPKGTYLAGGSALALHFGHRISIDFDFFTPLSFSEKKLAKTLGEIGTFKKSDISKDTLLGLFQNTRFSIFRYDYPLLFPITLFENLNIAHPKDIAAMKLAAIMDRGTKKDFVDLFFLIKKGVALEQSLKYYDKKYQALANNIYSLIISLSYFVDAEDTNMPKMIEKISWEEVKVFFKKQTILLAKKYI
ncbi:hypothetical protein A2859_00865 [Candidatus Roizmanbacteria bacterium RIFCSPHIGHO2_01_FULL_37_16b]|nr:MAG: hypothetical protein A2859_00865 [Candidatus Roizmanbacteria bacterium RIFCSPHIGHO2_01_FULL_37_16b]